jgi:anti-sigma-K factor RskA
MTCAWFLEHVHAYAIGALDAADRARLEAHLDERASHEGCFEALAEALETVAALDRAHGTIEPRSSVRESIFASIDSGGEALARMPASRRSTRSRGVVAAAAFGWGLAIAATIALVLVHRSNSVLDGRVAELDRRVAEDQQQLAHLSTTDADRRECRTALDQLRASSSEARAVIAMLDEPATRLVVFAPQGERALRATAVVDASASRAYVMGRALPAAPGKDYQLWVIRGAGAPIPAGFVRERGDGAAVGEFDSKILAEGRPDALAVSLEPAGGSRTPTDVVLVAKL